MTYTPSPTQVSTSLERRQGGRGVNWEVSTFHRYQTGISCSRIEDVYDPRLYLILRKIRRRQRLETQSYVCRTGLQPPFPTTVVRERTISLDEGFGIRSEKRTTKLYSGKSRQGILFTLTPFKYEPRHQITGGPRDKDDEIEDCRCRHR